MRRAPINLCKQYIDAIKKTGKNSDQAMEEIFSSVHPRVHKRAIAQFGEHDISEIIQEQVIQQYAEATTQAEVKVADTYALIDNVDKYSPVEALQVIIHEIMYEQSQTNAISQGLTPANDVWQQTCQQMLHKAYRDFDPVDPHADPGYLLISPGDFPHPVSVNNFKALHEFVASGFLIKCDQHGCDAIFPG